jgi:prevent-host-death family protein
MQVSMRELKSHLAQYIKQARAGQAVEVTSHRKVVARLSGVPHTGDSPVSRLLTSGAAVWQGGKPTGAALVLQTQGTLVSQMALDDRG